MKRSIAIVATLAIAYGATAFNQDTASLVRKYAEGATDKYTVSTKTVTVTDLSSMGQGEMEVNMDMFQKAAYTYKNVKEDGTADLSFKYTDIKITFDGPMAEMMGASSDQIPKEMMGTAKVDKFGRMTGYKLDNQQAAAMMQMWGGSSSMDPMSFFSLPMDSVTVGQEFKLELPKLPMFEQSGSTVKGKIIGSEKWQDKDAWKIEVNSDIKISMDMGEMMRQMSSEAPPMNMTLAGTAKSKSTLIVEKENGRMLQMDSSMTSDAMVKLVDMGFEFPVRTESVSTMKFVP